MDTALDQEATVGLTGYGFEEVANVLRHAGQSPRAVTRRNAIVAWSVLAGEAGDESARTHAVDGLVDTALTLGEPGPRDREVLEVAAKEITTLPPVLMRRASLRLRNSATSGRNIDQRRRAAQLALALAAQQVGPSADGGAHSAPLVVAFRGYAEQRRVQAALATLMWREWVRPVAVAALGIGLAVLIAMTAFASHKSMHISPDWSAFAIVPLSLLAAIVTGWFTLPSFTPAVWPTRLVDGVLHAFFVTGSVAFLGTWLLLLVLVQWEAIPEPEASTAEMVAWLVSIFSGTLIAKLAASSMPVPTNKPYSAMIRRALIAGGCGAALVIALAAASAADFLSQTWYLGDADILSQTWFLGVAITLSAAAGTGWVDAVYGALPARTEIEAVPRRWRIIVWAGPLLSILLLTVVGRGFSETFDDAREEFAENFSKWDRVARDRPFIVECRVGESAELDRVNLGYLYRVKPCPDNTLRIQSEDTRSGRKLDLHLLELPGAMIGGFKKLAAGSYPNPPVLRYQFSRRADTPGLNGPQTYVCLQESGSYDCQLAKDLPPITYMEFASALQASFVRSLHIWLGQQPGSVAENGRLSLFPALLFPSLPPGGPIRPDGEQKLIMTVVR